MGLGNGDMHGDRGRKAAGQRRYNEVIFDFARPAMGRIKIDLGIFGALRNNGAGTEISQPRVDSSRQE
jgi:hypothetical protein